jgi:predicted nucleotidyltransferase
MSAFFCFRFAIIGNYRSILRGSGLAGEGGCRIRVRISSQPDRSFHIKELIRLTGLGSASLQRELKRLDEAGLLINQPIGNLRRVHANPESPIFPELVALVRKTLGVVPVLRAAMFPFQDQIGLALVYGSVAKGLDHAGSDIDVLIVSDSVSIAELLPRLLAIEDQLGRKVSPTVYRTGEFARKRGDASSFFGLFVTARPWDVAGSAFEGGIRPPSRHSLTLMSVRAGRRFACKRIASLPAGKPIGASLCATTKKTKTPQAGPSFLWWRIRDSNPGPADYDSVALTG